MWDLFEGTLKLLAAYRVEVVVVACVWFIYGAALERVGSPGGELVTVALLGGLLSIGPLRRGLTRLLHRARTRRRFQRGCRRGGVMTPQAATW